MKKNLLKSMPHVTLQELKPELQEQNTQHDNEGIEDQNAVDDDQDNGPVNAVENIDATEEAPATFQYDPRGQENDHLGAGRKATEFLRNVFKRIAFNRYKNNHVGERTENSWKNVNYGTNENSESDSEEDFQEGIPLVRRTHRL